MIKRNEQKYLIDGNGDTCYLSKNLAYHYTLLENGYYKCDIKNSEKVYIPIEDLNKSFIPIEEEKKLKYNKEEEKFYGKYSYYYNEKYDTYIALKSDKGYYYYDDDDDDEDDDEHVGLEKIDTIYFKPDYEGLEEFLNSIIISKISTSATVDIVVQTSVGFDLKNHKIKPLEIDIDAMYNDDFKPVYDHIIKKLSEEGKGVLLLHGEAGAGKTNLLRHLTTKIDRKFIFLPINLISQVSSPAFIETLIDNKGSVLVIEDCENFIQDRNLSESSIVSPLLQISDGILSDMLDMKIICTYNNSTKIDPALKREGRLIAEYEFGRLSADKVEELSNGKYQEEMTLAEIFNELTYTENKQETKTIGFK